jgi:hypothetical protein
MHGSPNPAYRETTVGYQPSAVSFQLPAASFRLPASGAPSSHGKTFRFVISVFSFVTFVFAVALAGGRQPKAGSW